MHSTNQLGFIGEVKAITEFLKLGFNVYTPFSDGNDKFDFIAHKDGKLIRVEVKSTSSTMSKNSYKVYLKSRRGKKVHYFDPSKSDILVIYVGALDVICFFKSKNIINRNNIAIRAEISDSIYAQNHKRCIISDHIDLEKVIEEL